MSIRIVIAVELACSSFSAEQNMTRLLEKSPEVQKALQTVVEEIEQVGRSQHLEECFITFNGPLD